jgi:hypothetical protein
MDCSALVHESCQQDRQSSDTNLLAASMISSQHWKLFAGSVELHSGASPSPAYLFRQERKAVRLALEAAFGEHDACA